MDEHRSRRRRQHNVAGTDEWQRSRIEKDSGVRFGNVRLREATAIDLRAAEDQEMHVWGRGGQVGQVGLAHPAPPALYCCAVVFPAVPRNPWICLTA
jgi:hypothetical protein